jgi:hypothetical protein
MIAELTGELMVELVRSSFPPGTIFSKERVLSPIVIHFFARSVGELGRLAFFLGSSVKSFVTEAFRVQSLV